MRTGIFFYYQKGERLRDFPGALEGILEKENVFLYEAFYLAKPSSSFELEPISSDVLCQVHSPEMVEEVRKTGDFEGVFLSAAATVRAAEKIGRDEIENAFVFTGYGDHHVGRTFFWGGCYFNGAAIAIQELRRKFGTNRFAIIDTDAHHGDGTWAIFEEDSDVLYVCFCKDPDLEKNSKVNIQLPNRIEDEDYLKLVRESLSPRVRAFQPEILFWNWGYDNTRGEYGNMGLIPQFHVLLVRELKDLGGEICRGKMIVVLCGGSRKDLARSLIPQIISVLANP